MKRAIPEILKAQEYWFQSMFKYNTPLVHIGQLSSLLCLQGTYSTGLKVNHDMLKILCTVEDNNHNFIAFTVIATNSTFSLHLICGSMQFVIVLGNLIAMYSVHTFMFLTPCFLYLLR